MNSKIIRIIFSVLIINWGCLNLANDDLTNMSQKLNYYLRSNFSGKPSNPYMYNFWYGSNGSVGKYHSINGDLKFTGIKRDVFARPTSVGMALFNVTAKTVEDLQNNICMFEFDSKKDYSNPDSILSLLYNQAKNKLSDFQGVDLSIASCLYSLGNFTFISQYGNYSGYLPSNIKIEELNIVDPTTLKQIVQEIKALKILPSDYYSFEFNLQKLTFEIINEASASASKNFKFFLPKEIISNQSFKVFNSYFENGGLPKKYIPLNLLISRESAGTLTRFHFRGVEISIGDIQDEKIILALGHNPVAELKIFKNHDFISLMVGTKMQGDGYINGSASKESIYGSLFLTLLHSYGLDMNWPSLYMPFGLIKPDSFIESKNREYEQQLSNHNQSYYRTRFAFQAGSISSLQSNEVVKHSMSMISQFPRAFIPLFIYDSINKGDIRKPLSNAKILLGGGPCKYLQSTGSQNTHDHFKCYVPLSNDLPVIRVGEGPINFWNEMNLTREKKRELFDDAGFGSIFDLILRKTEKVIDENENESSK